MTTSLYTSSGSLNSKSVQPTPSSSSSLESKVEIFVDKVLGSGRFTVYHAYLPLKGTEYAIKVFPNERSSEAAFQREKEAMSIPKHRNVIGQITGINLKGLDALNSNLILMEYASHGTLYDFVLNKGFLEEKMIRTYFHQLIDGLEFLHSQGVAHMDLKLDNLLLSEDFILKIGDFDHSQKINEKGPKCRGTSCYRAPEVYLGKCQDLIGADVYSAGVILYTMRAREFPFVEHNDGTRNELIHYDLFLNDNEEFWKVKTAEKMNPNFFSESLRELLNGMMHEDLSKRFTLVDIKNSEWYNGPIFKQSELKIKMEKMWERIIFKKSLKRGRSPTN